MGLRHRATGLLQVRVRVRRSRCHCSAETLTCAACSTCNTICTRAVNTVTQPMVVDLVV